MSGNPDPKPPRTWRCRSCLTVSDKVRARKCAACGRARPKKREPKHKAVLHALDYQAFVEINGGEWCGICLRAPKTDGRRLHRDHDHKTGRARGLLDFRCNSALRYWMTPEWLRAAASYLERAA